MDDRERLTWSELGVLAVLVGAFVVFLLWAFKQAGVW